MKDYKRLTKFNGTIYYSVCYQCEKRENCNHNCWEHVYKRLGELEDKIEQGLLVELPVKAGTKVYMTIDYPAYFKPIEETVVTGVAQYFYPKENRYSNQITTSSCICFEWERDFGKTIFSTKAEAEVKRAELKGEKNEI